MKSRSLTGVFYIDITYEIQTREENHPHIPSGEGREKALEIPAARMQAGEQGSATRRALPRGCSYCLIAERQLPRVQPAPLPLRRRHCRRRRWLRARNRSRGRARAHGPRAPGGQEARHHWGTARSSPPGSWVSAPRARDGGARGVVVGPGWKRLKGHPPLPLTLGSALRRDEAVWGPGVRWDGA